MAIKRSPICAVALVAGLAGLTVAPGLAVAQGRRPSVASVQVGPADPTVEAGKTIDFYATAYDAGNNALDVTAFVWTSSNPRAATIDRETGRATGIAPGRTIITASYGTGRSKHDDQTTLQVTAAGAAPQPQAQPSGPAPQPAAPARAGGPGRPTGIGCAALERQPAGTGLADGLRVSPQRMMLVKGESQQLEYATIRGADGGPADPACIVFGVDAGGDRIIQVDSFGLVTARDTGRATFRATVQGARYAPKQIAVEVRADSVRFNIREVSLSPQTVDTLALVVPAQNNRRLDPSRTDFQFASSDTTKVRVSSVTPIVTAVAPGTARITGTSASYPDIHVMVNVHKPIRHLVGTPAADTVTLAFGSRVTLGVRLLAADSTAVENVPIRWTLLDSTIAAFDTATKTVRGVKMGNTRITVSAMADRMDSIWRHWYLRVVAGGLQIVTPRFALPVDSQRPLEVRLLDDLRRPLGPATALTWRSSADSIARVTDGRVTGVALGHAHLVAKASWDSTVAAEAYVVGDLLVPAARGNKWDLLMVQRGDAPRARPLLEDSVVAWQPAWSPSWTQIAYAAATNAKAQVFDIYVANADGSERRRVTSDSASAGAPSFVPPLGDSLVYEAGRAGKTQLYVVSTTGMGRRQLTTGESPNTHPVVSPDGKRVLFVSLRGGSYNIYQMNLDGTGAEQRLTMGRREESPAYAPDGKSFFYLRLETTGNRSIKRVYTQDLTTGVATALTPADVFVSAFSVSDDSQTLAITVESPDPQGVSHVELFDRVTQVRTPWVLPGVDRIGAPAFRPARPQAPPAQH
jgi:uncharacterized protein YjdB